MGRWWLPAFAGVAFSRNEFRWSPRIKREDGLIRLVPGLGTRAVDRVGDDFPVLAVPGQPGLRASVIGGRDPALQPPSRPTSSTWKPTASRPVATGGPAAGGRDDYPLVDKIFSVLPGRDAATKTSRFMMDPGDGRPGGRHGGAAGRHRIRCPGSTPLMTTLAEYLGTPVDIEFAHDGKDFYLLQCRPQAMTGDAAPAPIPAGRRAGPMWSSPPEAIVSNGWVPDITHIVYVVPGPTRKLPTTRTR